MKSYGSDSLLFPKKILLKSGFVIWQQIKAYNNRYFQNVSKVEQDQSQVLMKDLD